MSRAKKGLTLIEILIATAIMAAVLIPLATFIIGGMRRTEVSKHSTIALAIASNILDEVLGPNVPFDAIDTKGLSGDGAVTGTGLPKTLPSVGGQRLQATFISKPGAPGAGKLEGILNDRKRNDTRVKVSEEGLEFEIFFFAGLYADDNSNPTRADITKELTFSYIKNPYVPPDSVSAAQRILGLPASPATLHPMEKLFPYTRTPEGRMTTPIAVTDYYYGWPQPPNGYRPGATLLKDDIKKAFNDFASGPNGQDPKFFADFKDQNDFGKPKGGLMKIVLGVRWNPNTHVGLGVGYTRNSKEIWLVSLKADLAQH